VRQKRTFGFPTTLNYLDATTLHCDSSVAMRIHKFYLLGLELLRKSILYFLYFSKFELLKNLEKRLYENIGFQISATCLNCSPVLLDAGV